jgi:hypothetical protein
MKTFGQINKISELNKERMIHSSFKIKEKNKSSKPFILFRLPPYFLPRRKEFCISLSKCYAQSKHLFTVISSSK